MVNCPTALLLFPIKIGMLQNCPIALLQLNGASQGTINQGYAAGKPQKTVHKMLIVLCVENHTFKTLTFPKDL